jgi:hypothetical protein
LPKMFSKFFTMNTTLAAHRHNVPRANQQIFPQPPAVNRNAIPQAHETICKSICYIHLSGWPAVCSASGDSLCKVEQ